MTTQLASDLPVVGRIAAVYFDHDNVELKVLSFFSEAEAEFWMENQGEEYQVVLVRACSSTHGPKMVEAEVHS